MLLCLICCHKIFASELFTSFQKQLRLCLTENGFDCLYTCVGKENFPVYKLIHFLIFIDNDDFGKMLQMFGETL